jgi:hypothetical protein
VLWTVLQGIAVATNSACLIIGLVSALEGHVEGTDWAILGVLALNVIVLLQFTLPKSKTAASE